MSVAQTSTPKGSRRRNTPKRPGPWRLASIIDGRQLRTQLTAAALDNLHDEKAMRTRAMELLHGALFRGRIIAQERLMEGADGLDTARLLAAVQTEVLSALYDFTTTHVIRSRNPTEGERLALMATGGYGRQVLAPSSDVDLLFIRQYKQTPWAESVIEYMLYILWDMGIKVGHAFRTIDECIRLSRQDVTIKTSLLDAHFLAGDEALAEDMKARFQKEIISGGAVDFIADKLAERAERHAKHGASRYVVEPHIKNGKGGLRDLQTLFWLVKFTFGGDTLEDILKTEVFTPAEARIFLRAGRFLWTVRCHLHYITGRAEERLSFDLQPELAARFGYEDRGNRLGVERFMKRYFLMAKDVGSLTRILCARLEEDHKKTPRGIRRFLPATEPKSLDGGPFIVQNGRLSIPSESHFADHPVDLLRVFEQANEAQLDIHPMAMSAASRIRVDEVRKLRTNPDAIQSFLNVLTHGEDRGVYLRLMNESGVLGRMVPEFGGIVGQTQFNMYHKFTVDEHTLQAVDVLAAIERGDEHENHPLASRQIHRIENKRALYLAMLLHDTGKGLGDQQVEGAKTARRACLRLGLDAAEAELVAWLVGSHLEMSDVAQKRDISDPGTIRQFAELVGSVERLRLLLVLTVADIRAVGPSVWNGWKGQLLRDLFMATEAALRGGRTDETAIAAQIQKNAEATREAFLETETDVPDLMLKMEDTYWNSFDTNALKWHLEAINGSTDDIAIATRRDPKSNAIELLVAANDRQGLFADLTGALASQEASIATAHVFTSADGRVIDIFVLQDQTGQPYAQGEEGRLSRLRAVVLGAAISDYGDIQIAKPRVNRRSAAFIVEPVVSFDDDSSQKFTIVDVSGRDRPGLLYDIARVVSDHSLRIHTAHIGSYGERVFDAFYLQTLEGECVSDEETQASLKEALLNVLNAHEPDAPKTPIRTLSRSRAANSF